MLHNIVKVPTLSPSLLVVPDIDNSRLELSRSNLALEQNIRLTVRSILELRKEEVR